MADERRTSSGREDESWTDVENGRPDLVEAIPIRYGMVLGGRYAVDKIIGRGGCGVVVRAHDRTLRVSVAIKIVRAELAGERVWTDRLAREVKLARQINHPHVCRVFDFEQADGRAFLVMELAERGSLRDEMRAGAATARPWADRIADARAVASALAAIHAAGIVHRDLSPQNLLRMNDGRLVVSDFGLAVDVSDNTSSVHGGTVAYMAPEVLRGAKSTAASDVWALGIVMHEIVFGVKPEWKGEVGAQLSLPTPGRKATLEERAVLEACGACTAKDPARRIADAAEAGRMLTERRRWRTWRFALSKRPLILAAALALVTASAVGLYRARNRASEAETLPSIPESPLIVVTGEPADWTDVSTVLVEVPERITCTRLLPDKRTIRFVWGSPPHAEEIDTVTRRRVPSSLVPVAYAEGCPDLSSDGRRLVFQSHMLDGRAFAFLSDYADGRDASPVVQTAEPSMLSEPTWVAGVQAFTFDVDAKHIGVFWIAPRRSEVLPETTARSVVAMFRYAVDDRVIVQTLKDSGEAEFTGFSVSQFEPAFRFRVAQSGLDLASAGSKLFYSARELDRGNDIVELDLVQSNARRIGRIRDQSVRYPILVDSGISVVSFAEKADVFVRDASGRFTPITNNARIVSVKHCGPDLIVSSFEKNRMILQRLDKEGRNLQVLSDGPSDHSPACSPDGRVWYYSHAGVGSGIRRCDNSGCTKLAPGSPNDLSASPDGSRLAFVDFEGTNPMVKWISVKGGDIHEVINTETACPIGWSSSRTLWVSRRRGRSITWTEVDVDSRRETGRTQPGSRSCADSRHDPESPVDPDLRIVYQQPSQLRLLDRRFLTQK